MTKSQILGTLAAALVIFGLLSVAVWQRQPTEPEVVDKVHEVASALSNTGDVEQFNLKQWVWRDTDILVLNCGTVEADYLVRPKIGGLKIKDAKGVSILPMPKELCEAARQPNGTWTRYWWARADEKTFSPKSGYFLGAKGTPYVVGAGIYDDGTIIAKQGSLQSVVQLVKPVFIILSFPVGLGLIFVIVIFRLRIRSFVTGIVSPGPIPLQGKRRQKIGDYTILFEVGRGGMGTVFKAVGRQGQTVAIKLIGGVGLDRKAGATARNRVGLVREARLAASLRHPNIVKVFDIRREKHTLYVIMEYLEGAPLSGYIRAQRPRVLEALRIVAGVCDALSYAHGRAVVHRDIKPANIFITADKTVKVLDFGLAFQGDDHFGLAGTPLYMSPEQIIGRDVDRRSDVWSAGVTLFEILTGACPFAADNLPSLRIKIVNGTLPELPPELPYANELRAVLEKALSKDREARYQTADEFGMELRSLMVKIQQEEVDSPAMTSHPMTHDPVFSWNPNHSPERTAPPPEPIVNLGFKNQLHAPVFLIAPTKRKLWFDSYNISSLHALLGIVVVVGILLSGVGVNVWVLGLFWHQSSQPAPAFQALIYKVLATLFAVVIVGAGLRLAYESVSPHQVLQCRSCRRKMQTASDWQRFVWSVDVGGLCVVDCLTALEQDHWEDAVILFVLHTVTERLDTRYRLMFLECKACRDQRAYFWFSPPPVKNPVPWDKNPRWVEAYKFFDPRKAAEFAKAEKLRTRPGPAIPTKNAVDVHDQTTI